MCNEVARRIALDLIRQDFDQRRIPLRFSEGLPNLAAAASVRITDPTLIVRADASGEAGAGEAVVRRWSWPGQGGRPVYNYRSEGREFRNTETQGRCLIPIDGFYEFTTPQVPPGAPTPKRKDKWLFTPARAPFLCVAGLWRRTGDGTEAFTMLTMEPGPDVAPYHSRQIVLMPRVHWAAWLAGDEPAGTLIVAPPAGTLNVAPVVAGGSPAP